MKYLVPLQIQIKKLENKEPVQGRVEFEGDEYKLNLNQQSNGKTLRLPFRIKNQDKVLVRLTGENETMVEDFLQYQGMGEKVEIHSNDILDFVKEKGKKLSVIEVYIE